MTNEELDQSYSAVCEALTRIGEERSPLFLATLCLSLISHHSQPQQVQQFIRQAEAACAD